MQFRKKKLHLNFILKKQYNIKIYLNFLLIYTINNYFLIINYILLNFGLKKKINIFYSYLFKLSITDKVLLNNFLLFLLEKLKQIDIKLYFNFNTIKFNKIKYTVRRSTFVYKKSAEQFKIEMNKSFFFLIIGLANNFKILFLEYFFKQLICSFMSFKLLIIRFIYLN